MTAEIIARLEASFDAPASSTRADLRQLISDVVQEVLSAQRETADTRSE